MTDSPIRTETTDVSHAGEDPFFSLNGSHHWNAFVGRQGEERYYVDGFLEAAIELATAVIEKRLSGQRDTLVMPILFNTRHGLELSLKSAIRILAAGGILANAPPENHDIATLWETLANLPRCDAYLPKLVASMEPFVRSLAAVDEDGQALRYHVRRDGKQSLGDKSLVNLEVVHASLKALQSLLEEFGFRAEMLVDERRSGTCTAVCSRSDLFAITARLPQRADWNSEAFDTARAAIRKEFRLSSQQFQQALNVIQRHPQMGAMLGMEFELAHLSDEHAIFAAQLSRTLHPRLADIRRRGQLIIAPRKRNLKEIQQNKAALDAAVSQLVERLSADALADLETLYQMGRASAWPETYADRLADTKAELALQPSPGEFAAYLLGKGNLVEAVSVSVAQLGRPRLAEVLQSL